MESERPEMNVGGTIDIKKPKRGHLMTYEEYCAKDDSTLDDVPYPFEIKTTDQVLSYFGARHTYDPHHPEIPLIKEAWNSFLSETRPEHRIALVEGGVPDSSENEEEAITKNGEIGLVVYLAKKDGVRVESPEPPVAFEVVALLKQFSKEEILYYYVSRAADQWARTDRQAEMLQYILRVVSDEAEALGLKVDILTTLKETHQKLFGTALNLHDLEHFNRASDPVHISSASNEVARATSILRDTYILQVTEEKWREGKDLFIIYGQTHAVMQEPAIRHMIENGFPL